MGSIPGIDESLFTFGNFPDGRTAWEMGQLVPLEFFPFDGVITYFILLLMCQTVGRVHVELGCGSPDTKW